MVSEDSTYDEFDDLRRKVHETKQAYQERLAVCQTLIYRDLISSSDIMRASKQLK